MIEQKNQANGIDRTDIVDAYMDQLDLFCQEVITPVLPDIPYYLGDSNKKGKTNGQGGDSRVKQCYGSYCPFGAQYREIQVIH